MGFIRFIGDIILIATLVFIIFNGYKIYKSKRYLSKKTLIIVLVAIIGTAVGSPLSNMQSKHEITAAKKHSESIESKKDHSGSIKESAALSKKFESSNSKKETKSANSTSHSESSSGNQYKDINSLFDVNDMSKYSDDDLFASDVILPNFYVKDIGADKMGEYHLLLTPTEKSEQEFLAVGKTKQKISVGSTISIKGTISGRGTINQNQINVGINEKYINNKVILLKISSNE